MEMKMETARLRDALRGRAERLRGRLVPAAEKGCRLVEAAARTPGVSHRVILKGSDAVGQVALGARNAAQMELGSRTPSGGVPGRYLLTGALERERDKVVEAMAEALRRGDSA